MDLDEEGRTGLGFGGLGRREEDGEQDLKWRKKKKKEQRKKMMNSGSAQKSSLLMTTCYSKNEYYKLESLDTKIISNLG